MLPELWVMPGTGWTLKSFGFMMMVGFLSGVYLAMRRCMKVKCDPDAFLNIAFVALIVGVIGARVFFVAHYWKDSFADSPNPIMSAMNVTQGGLEFLGGVVPAALAVLVYIKLKGWSFRLYSDITAIVLAWALGIGRIGCFLNGCCFGETCADAHGHSASRLAVEFPFGSPTAVRQWEQREITVPAELIYDGFKEDGKGPLWEAMPIGRDLLTKSPEAREKPFREFEEIEGAFNRAKLDDPNSETTKQLAKEFATAKTARDQHQFEVAPLLLARKYPSREDPSRGMTYDEIRSLAAKFPAKWSHPTQLYDAVAGLLLANLMARVFHRRKRHGVVFGMFLVLYPIARFSLEAIRSDNPLDAGGFTASQLISMAMFIGGLAWLFVIYSFLPQRSPLAVAWVQPCEQADPLPV